MPITSPTVSSGSGTPVSGGRQDPARRPGREQRCPPVALTEVVAESGVRRRIGHGGDLSEARQVVTAGEFGELALYSATDCVFPQLLNKHFPLSQLQNKNGNPDQNKVAC